MRRTILAAALIAAIAGGGSVATAQIMRPPPPRGLPPPPITIEALQAQFAARSGSDTVYFAGTGHGLDAAAQATLTAQAAWLRSNPMLRARIEGHADERDPRDYALALGERRATAVRDFLILQGVPAAQLTIMSWGKERPAAGGMNATALALNRRVRTVLAP